MRRITTKYADDRMPPVKSGKTLTTAQIKTPSRWIDQGATWGRHWSFVPPKRPAAPHTNSNWRRNPIDNFVLARMRGAGLSPSEEADRRTLVRRLSLDLTGLQPSRYQGVWLRSGKEPVPYLNDPEVTDRIRQYEMAYRMQSSVPDLIDLSDEPESTFEEYGPDSRRPGPYAANCILARRLAERGMRFVQLFHPDWDHHRKLTAWCPARCRDTDQPTAALITDLKRRGLLDDTLVIWGGEFGRSPVGQGNYKSPEAGRDHHPRCFTVFPAGGGVKSGFTYGSTDESSSNVAEKPVHVHDLQATILHLLGMDHERLTYRYLGRDFRLTDVHGNVIPDILA